MPESVTFDRLRESVIAVPPLARHGDLTLNEAENRKLIRHVESGGVRTLLYGGNANFYHVAVSEFDQIVGFLEQVVAPETLVIPSVGPAYGTMMDQAKTLRRQRFTTAMVLPMQGMTTPEGVEIGVRDFVQRAGIPALLYLKQDGFIEPERVGRLAADGTISAVKYAIVRPDPSKDAYLQKLVDQMDPNRVISGIGEQPAVTHMRVFGLGGFTSGCVCVAPRLSEAMLSAIRAGDWDRASQAQKLFKPLEDLRNEIHPVRVLHEAIRLAGIADTGAMLPLMSKLSKTDHPPVQATAMDLLRADREFAVNIASW